MVKTSPGTDGIESEMRATRHDIDDKVERLQQRVSPGEIFDSVMEFARTNGGAVASSVGRTVRDHPLPLAMIGAGVVWLALSGRGSDDYGDDYATARSGHEGEGMGQRLRHQAADIGERAGEMTHRVRDQATRAGRSGGRYVKEHPVLIGAAGLALGAALAAVLPRTSRENSAFGERAERAREAARDAAARQGRKVQEAAKSAVEKAREAAERKAPTTGELKREGENVARAATGSQPGGESQPGGPPKSTG